MQIRDEWPTDAPGIRSLLDQAFPDEPVGQLVDTLRQDGDLALSLIAEQDGEILGHVGFSPVAIAPCLSRVLQLAPLAVAEPIRRQGIGAALVGAAMERCRVLGIDAVLVLGDPAYYRRFGFDPARAASLRSRWSGPHLMALELTPGSLRGCTFFTLPPVFDLLP